MIIEKPQVMLLAHTNEPEAIITAAAKLCYSNLTPSQLLEKQTEEGVCSFINRIMALGHGSILEHATFTFGIEDISRVTEVQLVRHRTGSPSIQSGRYVKRNPHFIVPPNIKNDDVSYSAYLDICEQSTNTYLFLIDRLERILVAKELGISLEQLKSIGSMRYEEERKKITKIALEDARYALLQSLRTHAVFSIDLRNLINLLAKRKCRRAQWEIQEVAMQIEELLQPVLPNIADFIGAPCEFGKCPEGAMSCGKKYPRKNDAIR